MGISTCGNLVFHKTAIWIHWKPFSLFKKTNINLKLFQLSVYLNAKSKKELVIRIHIQFNFYIKISDITLKIIIIKHKCILPPSTLNFLSSWSEDEHRLHKKSFLTVADSVAPGTCTLTYWNPERKQS